MSVLTPSDQITLNKSDLQQTMDEQMPGYMRSPASGKGLKHWLKLPSSAVYWRLLRDHRHASTAVHVPQGLKVPLGTSTAAWFDLGCLRRSGLLVQP